MPQSIRKLQKVWRSEDYGSKAIAHNSEPHQIGGAFLCSVLVSPQNCGDRVFTAVVVSDGKDFARGVTVPHVDLHLGGRKQRGLTSGLSYKCRAGLRPDGT